MISPTISSGDAAVNNADLVLLCTHSVSRPLGIKFTSPKFQSKFY